MIPASIVVVLDFHHIISIHCIPLGTQDLILLIHFVFWVIAGQLSAFTYFILLMYSRYAIFKAGSGKQLSIRMHESEMLISRENFSG